METIINTHNLTKQYGTEKVVDNVNMNIEKGGIYGFLGLNGAGKTTTLRMLLGLAKPTRGSFSIFGRDFKSNKKYILPRIGSLIEVPGFYGNLTAVENLKINKKLLGVQSNHVVEETLENVGLLDARNKLVKNYSLGMKQRLGIARAILHNPELLILDEPTNGLDPGGIKEVRKMIKELAEKRKITILMSSHILSEVQQLATTIGIIHKGKLLEEITFDELRKKNKRYVEVVVSDDGRATMLLERKLNIKDYDVHENRSIRVYSDLEKIEHINKLFNDNDILVSKLKLSEDNLEDYFLKLTGGDRID
ncbi:ABC transporter ATP-binding protein [Dethiothermospora halolimnae]|uniref:ABC transporter ATP-binding protein n=1 Tax=Dethiothermospora halolimnae TaxID=3114390 RepID=UPI003CCBBC89